MAWCRLPRPEFGCELPGTFLLACHHHFGLRPARTMAEYALLSERDLVSTLHNEACELVLQRFDADVALELGQAIREEYLRQHYPKGVPASYVEAAQYGQPLTGIVVSVQSLSGQDWYASAAGWPAATSSDNWDWVRRKAATVRRFGAASFQVGRERVAKGKAPDAGLDTSVYAAHGGGVPIYVGAAPGAPVGLAVVSGLAQAEDHSLVVRALRLLVARQGQAAQLAGNCKLPPVKRQLIVFDFDWSLADQDTDRWVHESLAPHLRRRMKSLMPHMQFTDLCAMMLRELWAEGKTPDDIKEAMRGLPFHPGMVRGVTSLKADSEVDTTFFLLSNSNIVYIDTVLSAKKLQPPEGPKVFEEIVTNPAQFLPSGLLELKRRIPPAGEPGSRDHGCKVGCSPNMCKGEELDAFIARHGGRDAFDRVVYVGDGGNDYCPVLRLGPQDAAFVRTGRGLEQRIRTEGNVQAGIRWWAGAWEMEGLLGELHSKDPTVAPVAHESVA